MPTERPPTSAGEPDLSEDTLQASRVVSLGGRAAREGVSVADQVTLRDQGLREQMVDRILPAFLWANGLTLGAIAVLWLVDQFEIAFRLIAPGDRIITSQVIMALLAATTVQVGAIAAIIARYLFPGRR